MNNEKLIKLIDGAILDIETDGDNSYDPYAYDAYHRLDLIIIYENKDKDIIRDESIDGITLSNIMKIFLNYYEDIIVLKEKDVTQFIKNKLENEFGCTRLEII